MPRDYDSEFQYGTRAREALMAGHIDVERSLQYQVEVKRGDHTACSGRFFGHRLKTRDLPPLATPAAPFLVVARLLGRRFVGLSRD